MGGTPPLIFAVLAYVRGGVLPPLTSLLDGIESDEGRSEAAVGSEERGGMEQAGAGGPGVPGDERALAWVVEEGEGRSTGNTSNNVTTRASSRVQKDDRGAGGRTEVSWIDAGLTQLRSIYDKMKE